MLFGSKLQRSTLLFTTHDKYLILTLHEYICHKSDFIVISNTEFQPVKVLMITHCSLKTILAYQHCSLLSADTEMIQIPSPRGLKDGDNTTECPRWMAASDSEQTSFLTVSKFL